MFVNYAHRGASEYAPENTMSAFKKAIELKSTGIELDLQMTKDGKIVVFHDKNIDRLTNGLNTGKIIDYTYEQLLQFDFGSWFNSDYKNEKIVLFEEFARDFFDKDLTFAIELKSKNIEEETLRIVNKYATYDKIYITSYKYKYLKNMRKLDSKIKLSWLIEERINEKNIKKLLDINGNQICPKATLVCNEDIKLAKENNLEVRLWGVTNEDIMKKVYNLDIEGMTVNFPDKLNKLLEENKNGI